MTKKIFCLLFFVLATFFLTTPIYADETEDLQNKISEYTQKLNELGTAKNTLANQIKILNSQYELTQLKITQTENSIKGLEQEINNLSVEIDKLNIQLNDLSQLFVYQTAQNYKNQKKAPLFFFLLKANLNDFLQQNQYVSSVRQNNQENLVKMGTIKERYDIQKTAKTKKQQDMETLQKTLAAQKISLNSQKAAKDQLLAVTKNDEKKYQQMLNDAIAQLSAFRTFTSGGSLLSNQTHCDEDWGCYFNQRDSEWGNMVFGWSSENGKKVYYDMKGYGCLITSVTMVLKHYGKSVKPSDLAQNSSLFDGTTGNFRFGNLSTNGFDFSRTTIGCTNSLSLADSELNAGRPVVAGVGGSCRYPAHFIVIKYKKDGQYIINDPYPEFPGFNKTFSSTKYNLVRMDSIRLK